MLENIELEAALEILLSGIQPLPEETVTLFEALDRAASCSFYADQNIPSWPQAAVDGFAICGNGLTFSLLQNQADGMTEQGGLETGQAARVVTGGPLPLRTDGVVYREQAKITGNQVNLSQEWQVGGNIKWMGEDFRKGDLLAARGASLDPGSIALLAAFGISLIPVFSRPKVAILSLGSHIVPHFAEPGPWDIRDSNGPLLASIVRREGGQVIGIQVVSDKREAAEIAHLLELIAQADLVITTGGTFAEISSEAELLFQQIGAKPLFRDVNLKPGGHNAAALWEGRIILSLSGNPAACLVGGELLAVPLLRFLQGKNSGLRYLSAACLADYARKTGVRQFLMGRAQCFKDGWTVDILPDQKSSRMRPFIKCNALVDLCQRFSPIRAGEILPVILLSSSCGNFIG